MQRIFNQSEQIKKSSITFLIKIYFRKGTLIEIPLRILNFTQVHYLTQGFLLIE